MQTENEFHRFQCAVQESSVLAPEAEQQVEQVLYAVRDAVWEARSHLRKQEPELALTPLAQYHVVVALLNEFLRPGTNIGGRFKRVEKLLKIYCIL